MLQVTDLRIGDKVSDCPTGEGEITAITEDGYPVVNGAPVAWIVTEDGYYYDPHDQLPQYHPMRLLKDQIDEHSRRLEKWFKSIKGADDPRTPKMLLRNKATRELEWVYTVRLLHPDDEDVVLPEGYELISGHGGNNETGTTGGTE